MKQHILKTLIFIFILLGQSQQGMSADTSLEELGIFKNPDTGKYVHRHIDHYTTAEEMGIAERLCACARAQLKANGGISGLADKDKSEVRRAIILTYGAAAYFGNPEALEQLSDSLSTDWSGEGIYEREAARAAGTSPARSLWERAKDYQRRGRPIPEGSVPTMEGVEIPKKILEARREAEEERKEAEEAARRAEAAARAATAAGAGDDEESKREDAPLLGGLRHRPPKATGHLDEEGLAE
jgi:hypothetical protein